MKKTFLIVTRLTDNIQCNVSKIWLKCIATILYFLLSPSSVITWKMIRIQVAVISICLNLRRVVNYYKMGTLWHRSEVTKWQSLENHSVLNAKNNFLVAIATVTICKIIRDITSTGNAIRKYLRFFQACRGKNNFVI